MTDDLEHQLTTLLRDRVDDLAARVDAPTGLARRVRRRRTARRVTAGGVALLALTAVFGTVALVSRDGATKTPVISAGPSPTTSVRDTVAPSTTPDGRPIASGTWTPLPEAPIAGRSGAAFAWTGEEMIVWSGWGTDLELFSDGAAYDPRTRTWRSIAAAPIEGRANPAAVWTGSAVFVWGGARSLGPTQVSDGALYDPGTDSWDAVPAAPISVGYDPWAVWTGREVVVGGEQYGPPTDGVFDDVEFVAAAYDPAARTWRSIDVPATEPATWGAPIAVEGELLFWEGSEGRGFAYDLDTGEQRPLTQVPGVEMSGTRFPDFNPLFWTGSEVIGRGSYGAWAYDPAADSYRELPAQLTGHSDAVAWTGSRVLSWGGSITESDGYDNDGVSIDPATGGVFDLPPVELEERQAPAYAWTGEELIVWGGKGSQVVDGPPGPETGSGSKYFADGAAFRPDE